MDMMGALLEEPLRSELSNRSEAACSLLVFASKLTS